MTASATRAFLNARPKDEIDWKAVPARYKRYPVAGRSVLAWAAEPADALGSMLRDLMGLRHRGTYPVTLKGMPRRERPTVDSGRPVPSGGALYPIEAYLCTGPTPERAAGLYHYDAAHHCLDLVRPGDHRGAVAGLLSAPPAGVPDLVIALTAVFWRNGFKYRDFAYNLHCQETGALAAQFLALADLATRSAAVHVAFRDHQVNSLLGVDHAAEGALAVLTLGSDGTARAEQLPTFAELAATPAAQSLEPMPGITTSLPHLARLHTAASRVEIRDRTRRDVVADAGAAAIPLPAGCSVRLADGIPARASGLFGYRREPVDLESLAAVLRLAAPGFRGDLPDAREAPVGVGLHVLVDRVRGLEPGAYRYEPEAHSLTSVGDPTAMARVRSGPVHENTSLGLAGAAAVVIPVGDPLTDTHGLGDRWYRVLQIETGLVVHRATLAATARGLSTRIHSDGANYTTDTVLGLRDRPERSLSFLLLGHRRLGPTLPGPPAYPRESQ